MSGLRRDAVSVTLAPVGASCLGDQTSLLAVELLTQPRCSHRRTPIVLQDAHRLTEHSLAVAPEQQRGGRPLDPIEDSLGVEQLDRRFGQRLARVLDQLPDVCLATCVRTASEVAVVAARQ